MKYFKVAIFLQDFIHVTGNFFPLYRVNVYPYFDYPFLNWLYVNSKVYLIDMGEKTKNTKKKGIKLLCMKNKQNSWQLKVLLIHLRQHCCVGNTFLRFFLQDKCYLQRWGKQNYTKQRNKTKRKENSDKM